MRRMINPKNLRRLGIGVVILGVLAGLLALDLKQHGRVWQWFWSLTGEENPLAQIRGIVELAGNLTRAQPQVDAMVPIDHTWENPYGVNTFLEQEVEVPKIEEQLRMIADAGFYWVRQEFPWEDLEVDGRGKFTDSRNDFDKDGKPDTVDAWAKYDRIVNLVEKYGLHLQVRLSHPPGWTHAANPNIGSFAPPDNVQDYVDYAAAVAQRYKGRVFYYQVWNEPNIYPEWGEQAVNPEAYTDLLCRTYKALKTVDPNIVVISGALAPTVSLTTRDLNDFIFLQRMYQAGAGQCFDVLSMQGYGLNSGPTDHRMRPTFENYARNLYIRDLMVANGDAHKAIWISEAAWNAVPDDPSIIGAGNYGRVTYDQAARYMPVAYQRAQEEWPWVGVINYWFFTRPSDNEKTQASYYFRMVEPDYNPAHPTYTPLPVYNSVKEYITSQFIPVNARQPPTLYPGVHQAEDWAIWKGRDTQFINAPSAQLGKALRTTGFVVAAYGTDVIIRWQSAQALQGGTQDWVETHITLSDFGAVTQHAGYMAGDGLVIPFMRVPYPFGDSPFVIDSITVLDRSFEQVFPLAGVGVALLAFAAWVLVSAWRERRG